ncbi:biotin--[acetyl-CoA-carboxylase] ligase [Apibacter sp. HY039]|uniref:biotin--[acetyl-CoA-carboxylase] ligase n=1 Tax=Apibacter sp. HY039 TaxID=2501476 RepID=UPI000FEB8907|nr:biotin--[acetyl-CoA-carboxylase] ligase [Apibacter sp. HY039]
MPLQYFDEINSTNEYIRNNIYEFKENFSGIFTFNQLRGKGQRDSEWICEPEKNIALTFCLSDPFISIINLSFWVGLISCDFLEKESGLSASIKWPNDIIIRKKKISGILIEKTQDTFIIGIGINIMQSTFDSLSSATSLNLLTNKNYNLVNLTEKLYLHFQEHYSLLFENKCLLEKYNLKLFGRNKVMTFSLNQKQHNGIIEKVTEDGLLCVNIENMGTKLFRNKEIKFLY